MPIGLMVFIPIGGQAQPRFMTGLKLLWKNVQKNDIKKQISLIINSAIPIRSPFCVCNVCFPIIEASRTISRHH